MWYILKTSCQGRIFHITDPLWSMASLRKGPMIGSFDVLFVVYLVRLLNKWSHCLSFGRPWHSCDITVMLRHLTKLITRSLSHGIHCTISHTLWGQHTKSGVIISTFTLRTSLEIFNPTNSLAASNCIKITSLLMKSNAFNCHGA